VAEAGAPVHEATRRRFSTPPCRIPRRAASAYTSATAAENISDYVDVEAVVDAVKNEPGVVVAKTTIFACADASQSEMEADIVAENLDGLVVASALPSSTS